MFNIDDANFLSGYQADLTVALPIGSYRVGNRRKAHEGFCVKFVHKPVTCLENNVKLAYQVQIML